MKADQNAVIQAAQRKGLAPSEVAAELLTHDLLNSALNQIRGHAVAFKNMSEQQQDACIQTMQEEFKKSVDTAVRIIASVGTKTVRMKLKKVAIGTNYQIQGVAGADEEHLHALCDKAQDQSDVLIVLYEGDYHQGLDAIQGEKDQRDLPLEGKATKAAAKPKSEPKPKTVEVTPAQIDAAREFVTKQQNGTLAGLQNQLKCNIDKARALHDVLAAEGLLSAEPNERGDRDLVRQPAAEAKPQTASETPESTESAEAPGAVSLELYVKAKTAVITERRVSVAFLCDELGVTSEEADQLLARMEEDGVVTEENELGARQILIDK